MQSRHQRWEIPLLVSCFAIAVAAGRCAIVFLAGSPVPYHDQWYAEAQALIIPASVGGLHPGNFFWANNEHPIVLTRLLALGLVEFQGRWDCIAQMLVNALLSSLCLLPLIGTTARKFTGVTRASVIALIAALYGSPLYYGNVIWGFQSQVILMVALSLAHLHCWWNTAPASPSPTRFAAGAACAVLAAFAFGSGCLAPCASLLVAVFGAVARRNLHSERRSLVGAAALAVFGLGTLFAIVGIPRGLHESTRVLHTLFHALAFPSRFYSNSGVIVCAPFVVALFLGVRSAEFFERAKFPLAVALWGLLQALALAWGRGGSAVVLAPRYYDILTPALVANGLLLLQIGRWVRAAPSFPRFVVPSFAVVWIALVVVKATTFAWSHTVGDLPVLEDLAVRQTNLLRTYFAGGLDRAVLDSQAFPVRPLPDTGYLNEALHNPRVQQLLPSAVRTGPQVAHVRELSWAGVGRDREFKVARLVYAAAVGALLVMGLLSLRPRDDAPQPLRV